MSSLGLPRETKARQCNALKSNSSNKPSIGCPQPRKTSRLQSIVPDEKSHQNVTKLWGPPWLIPEVMTATQAVLSRSCVYFRWTPHPVIVTMRDNRDYIRDLLYSYYTTITGWGVLLMCTSQYGPLQFLRNPYALTGSSEPPGFSSPQTLNPT